jgi:hypothetical protein
MLMKRILTFLFLIFTVAGLSAQNNQKGDLRSANQNTVIRIDRPIQNGWVRVDNDEPAATSTPVAGNENVSFSATADGIYVTILSGTNKIKLYALTGQLLANGELSQGHFFIFARKGIYLLKVNNKSYKVICK